MPPPINRIGFHAISPLGLFALDDLRYSYISDPRGNNAIRGAWQCEGHGQQRLPIQVQLPHIVRGASPVDSQDHHAILSSPQVRRQVHGVVERRVALGLLVVNLRGIYIHDQLIVCVVHREAQRRARMGCAVTLSVSIAALVRLMAALGSGLMFFLISKNAPDHRGVYRKAHINEICILTFLLIVLDSEYCQVNYSSYNFSTPLMPKSAHRRFEFRSRMFWIAQAIPIQHSMDTARLVPEHCSRKCNIHPRFASLLPVNT